MKHCSGPKGHMGQAEAARQCRHMSQRQSLRAETIERPHERRVLGEDHPQQLWPVGRDAVAAAKAAARLQDRAELSYSRCSGLLRFATRRMPAMVFFPFFHPA